MMQKRPFGLATLALAGAAILAVPAIAQNMEAIEKRQQLMEDNGDAAKLGGAMLKGEQEFTADKAAQVFSQMHDIAMKFGDYFPEDSKTGGDTEAAPAIWEQPEEFQAALVKYQEDTQAAMDAAPQDIDAFKQAFGMVTQNCKGCHEDFRLDKD
ncbi:c-type cytochrome [Jiella marina]|uniref:c-type cytochrome n=1 Tax=Jiella sp. LLJ827 TaxID=2917712 RepID=UPI00210100FB|nr:cytochrome c [Jiella sp. LLJ827]MCQ0989769.1 cytochrome c [Jiella sp. LLJ827]